jgi:hypothetical protein
MTAASRNIELTIWYEIMTADNLRPENNDFPPDAAHARQGELHNLFTWMDQLRASLERGSRALLALDLEGIRQQTAEQAILTARLRCELARMQSSRRDARYIAPRAGLLLEAARLHLGILARLQRKLRVMANMLAGPNTSYGPPDAVTLPVASGKLITS